MRTPCHFHRVDGVIDATREPHTPSTRYAGAALSLGAVAPYGRYADAKALGISDWGPKVPAQLAWCLQELPSLLVPLVCLVRPGWGPASATNGVLLLCFLAHYANRALVYPLRIRGGAPTPAYVMASAALFTLTNGYLQAGALGGPWASAVPGDAAFGGGLLLFLAGALGNAYHDALLRALREPGETGYKVPIGGLFDYVSGANYLCEIVEWAGFAIACRTRAAHIFAWCVVFNLAPRAVSHHAWYREKFGDAYPVRRRALVPFLF